MGSKFEQFFKIVPSKTPPQYLCERILLAVERERVRQARTRLAVSSLSGMSSLVGLVFALPALFRAADTTGFSTYAPLLISDSDMITTHFSTFVSPLLETLPGFEVTITLFLLAVLLVSFKNMVQGSLQAHLSFFTAAKAHLKSSTNSTV
jgi:hypothetical protein